MCFEVSVVLDLTGWWGDRMRERGGDPEDFPKEVPPDMYFKHRGVQSVGYY